MSQGSNVRTIGPGLESYIERVVSEAPPLTPDQRDRISLLLFQMGAEPEAWSPSGAVGLLDVDE